MGVHEFLGVGYSFRDEWIDAIRGVTAEDVVRAAREYFSTENYILATAGLAEDVQKAESATQ
jgi:predicted Zn-dependent peptidase